MSARYSGFGLENAERSKRNGCVRQKNLQAAKRVVILQSYSPARMSSAAQEEVKKLEHVGIATNSQNDMMKQVADVEDLLAKGIDGLGVLVLGTIVNFMTWQMFPAYHQTS
jgi:hypothetical protein